MGELVAGGDGEMHAGQVTPAKRGRVAVLEAGHYRWPRHLAIQSPAGSRRSPVQGSSPRRYRRRPPCLSIHSFHLAVTLSRSALFLNAIDRRLINLGELPIALLVSDPN